MSAGLLTPSRNNWGQYQMPDGTVVSMKDVSEQIFYDSEILPAIIPAGQEYRLCLSNVFSTGAVKAFGLDYNLPEWGRVPKEWYFSIKQIGFHTQVGIPFADLRDIMNAGYYNLISGGQKSEADGLILHAPIGVGVGGAVSIDGNVGANEVSALNNGTPAPGSVANKMYSIELPEQTSFELRLRFPGGATLIAARHIYFAMKVLRFKPIV